MALRRFSGGGVDWVFVILGLGGFGLAWLGTSTYGIGLSPDSIHYIHAARSVMSGDGYQAFGGVPFIGWPPLFPSTLAALGKFGLEPLDGARVLNAAVYGLTIFAAGRLLRTHLRSSWLAVAAAATLLVSLTLVRVSIMAWSEPLFVLLAVLFVIFLSWFIRERRFTFFLLAAGCAALASLDRYIGFSLAIAGAGAIFVLMTALTWQRRAAYAGIFGTISLVPLGLWLARNQRVSDSFTGNRASPESGFIENLGDSLAELSSWLLPSQYISSSSVHMVVVALAVLALSIVVAYLVWAKRGRGARDELLWLAPAGIFVLVYTGSLVITASLVGFDTIGGRLLSPVYVFVLLFVAVSIEEAVRALSGPALHRWLVGWVLPLTGGLLVVAAAVLIFGRVNELACGSEAQNQVFLSQICGADGAFRPWGSALVWLTGFSSLALGIAIFSLRRKKWTGRVAISGIISIWLLYSVVQTGVYVKTRTDSGAGGFNSEQWRESPLIQRLRFSPLDGTVYSNVPDIVYILTQTDNAKRPETLPVSPEELAAYSKEDAWLVWIGEEGFRSSQTFQTVASGYNLIDETVLQDSGIFLIRK